jgi:solute carrier family 8 (sodium/calcium exchanger)
MWNNNFRAFLYILFLLWCFVGVSVLADAFMGGIEAITSATWKKLVPRCHRDGRPMNEANGQQIVDTIEIPVWNEKVACLSLMALGSSAPEILIACVGCAPEFLEDELGPGTVVGSATFNLYVITGLCMIALDDGEQRKIDGLIIHAMQVP